MYSAIQTYLRPSCQVAAGGDLRHGDPCRAHAIVYGYHSTDYCRQCRMDHMYLGDHFVCLQRLSFDAGVWLSNHFLVSSLTWSWEEYPDHPWP